MFAADQVLAEMEKAAPDITAACLRAYNQGHRDLEFFRLDKEAFSACPSDSIDYAVMEHTMKGAMVPLRRAGTIWAPAVPRQEESEHRR